MPAMKRILAWIALGSSALASFAADPARLLDKPEALPLALSDEFEFRKVLLFQNGGRSSGVAAPRGLPGARSGRVLNIDPSIDFETKYRNFGAINELDRRERQGQYFTFFWRAARPARLTLRLEYRQERLGPYIQAREIDLGEVRGGGKTEIAVVGDDFLWDGRINSWRAVLIEDGRIVALHSSALWN